jgi:hypothetical protein
MNTFKRTLPLLFLLLLAACASSPATEATQLVITGDQPQQTFTLAQLQALPATTATFNGVDYTGVSLKVLLEQAGYNAATIEAVEASATDGYSVKYERDLALLDSTLVAYALAGGGSLGSEDGTFRMVLPDQEGKLNVRMLGELHVNP